MSCKASLLMTTAAALLIAVPAHAIEVSRSVDVAASSADTWAGMGDFCAIQDWHPVIAACEEFELTAAPCAA